MPPGTSGGRGRSSRSSGHTPSSVDSHQGLVEDQIKTLIIGLLFSLSNEISLCLLGHCSYITHPSVTKATVLDCPIRITCWCQYDSETSVDNCNIIFSPPSLLVTQDKLILQRNNGKLSGETLHGVFNFKRAVGRVEDIGNKGERVGDSDKLILVGQHYSDLPLR